MTRASGVHVIGAGGHARVIISTLRARGYCVEAIYDDNPEVWGNSLLGVPIRGSISDLPGRNIPAVIGVGNSRIRLSLVERVQADWLTLVHPHAHVDPTVRIGEGTVVFAGAVVQPSVHIGRHVIVNTGATVDHNCSVGDFAHIAPGANLCGHVQVAEGAWVGAGAVVIENTIMGPWSYAGAGSVVVRDLDARVLAVGCPARSVRMIED